MEYFGKCPARPCLAFAALLASSHLLSACASAPSAFSQQATAAADAFKVTHDFPEALYGKTVRVVLECCGPRIAYYSPNGYDIFVWTPDSRTTLNSGLSVGPNDYTVCFGTLDPSGVGSSTECFDFGNWVAGVKEIVDGDILHLSTSNPPWRLKETDRLSIPDICARTPDDRCRRPLKPN